MATSPIRPVLPLCGKINVNGFVGDAVFRTGQGPSTITRRLARICPPDPKQYPDLHNTNRVVRVECAINGWPFVVEMKIYEESHQDLESLFYIKEVGDEDPTSPDIYEVIFGNDFMMQLGSLQICFKFGKISCPNFGDLAMTRNRMTAFYKDFSTTNYSKDLDNRVIFLLDMDAFEVQVYQEGWMIGKPRVVANASNVITAVSYEAKKLGISRKETKYVNQALQIEPNLIIIPIPTISGTRRPDRKQNKLATVKIRDCVKQFLVSFLEGTSICELNSGDEFYIEVTPIVDAWEAGPDFKHWASRSCTKLEQLWENAYLYSDVASVDNREVLYVKLNQLAGLETQGVVLSRAQTQEKRLLYGSTIADKLVRDLKENTGFESSVGVGSKKLMAKIASGVHKPGAITIASPLGFENLAKVINLQSIPGLGGSRGVDILNLRSKPRTMLNLSGLSVNDLNEITGGVEDDAVKILNSANGLCDQIVQPTDSFKSCTTSQRYNGRTFSKEEIYSNAAQLCEEFLEYLQFEHSINARLPSRVKLNVAFRGGAQRPNINSHLQPVNICFDGSQQGGCWLNEFIDNANIPFQNWPLSAAVEEIKFVAEFN